MKPTMKLRWKIPPGTTVNMRPILQQWWEHEVHHDYCPAEPPGGEWRDVLFEVSSS